MYYIGDKVEYYYRSIFKKHYSHGIVKAIRRTLLGTYLIVKQVKTDRVNAVPMRNVFGKLNQEAR